MAEDPTGAVVGFANGGPQRDGFPDYAGELYAIYLLNARQRRDLGRALIGAVAGHLLAHGFGSMLVWVLRDNPSRGFYERLDGQRVAQKDIQIGGATLMEVAYGWPDIRPLAQMLSDKQANS